MSRPHLIFSSKADHPCYFHIEDGACHAMVYPLESKYSIPHGDANASLLSAVMRFNVLGNMGRFKAITICMGENVEGLSVREAAYKAVKAVETLC